MNKKQTIIVLIIIFIGVSMIFPILSDISGVRIDNSVTISIDDGTSGTAIAKKLKEQGVIRYPKLFLQIAKQKGYAQQFKSGEITITPSMSYEDIMKLLMSPTRDMVKITIPEGYELRQIMDRLEEAKLIDRAVFEDLLKAENFDYRFLDSIPNRPNQLEGYLFPDTYLISKNATEKEIIDLMLGEFNKQFEEKYYEQAKKLGMTIDEIVTLASIIERETSHSDERPLVSGVFHNRIRYNMKLQSCATVEYVLQERKAVLSIKDTQIESKYNTYKYSGLPIGPIASPSKECIESALYPSETTAKYFVLGKDGKHIFSQTYQEHLDAKRKSEQ